MHREFALFSFLTLVAGGCIVRPGPDTNTSQNAATGTSGSNGSGGAPTSSGGGSSSCGASNFGSISLTTGFMPDPQSVSGTSGGATDATALGESQTGPCRGWIASQPDHTMTLGSSFDFLAVSGSSSDDTTLVIRGPDGMWCSDDEGGDRNPRIAGAWVPGCYQIWVGSYEQGDNSAYQLSFTERR